jgi:regulator of sigma E protease
MTPRKFYIGFGPPIARTTRGGVEYGIGSIPLGGYVKIPGMNRPSPGDFARMLPPHDARRHAEEIRAIDERIEHEDYDGARERLLELKGELGESRVWQELEGGLAPEAYWRAATWRRLTAIFAGPAVNLVFAIVLFTALFMVASDVDTNVVGRVAANSPAASVHLHAGDRILAVAGQQVTPKEISKHVRATKGAPFRLLVARNGRRVTIGPVRAKLDHGAYRIGIAINLKTGPGESPPAAARDALSRTWQITSGTVVGLSHLATGRDTNQVSSSVGIVRVSAAAWRQGLSEFLYVLGLISLALGLLNLVPVLPLDGGHIVMALLEKVRGRTFNQAVYLRYSVVGLSLFMLLMYFGLRNDLFGGGG